MTRDRQRHLALMRVYSSPVLQDRIAVLRKVCDGVAADELQAQRALGTDWIDAYLESWAVADDAYTMLVGRDRPPTLTQFQSSRKVAQ